MTFFFLRNLDGVRALNVTDVRIIRERTPLLWGTVGETALAKGFYSNVGIRKSIRRLTASVLKPDANT